MRFQHVAPFALLLLLPFAASDNAIDPKLEGMADVCVCIDIIYENLTDDNKDFGEVRAFVGSPQGIYGQLNISNGVHRLAFVKIDHNGYHVLMNLSESIVHSYGHGWEFYLNYSNVLWKLHQIVLANFSREDDQKTQRTTPLKELLENIKKEVFTPQKGDRPAPNIMVYVHLTDEKNLKKFEHYKPYLDAGFDIVAGLTTYKAVSADQKGDTVPAFFRLYNKGNWEYLDFIVSSGSGEWPLKKWVGELTNMCKGQSTYNYTDCYYFQDPADAYGQQCGKYKNFTPPAGVEYADYCWKGEWEMEECNKTECDNTCENLLDKAGPCDAQCGKTGTQTKTHSGGNKQGKYCKKQVTCTGTCTTTAKTTKLPPNDGQTKPQNGPDTANPTAADTGLPTWAWAAIGGGIGAIVIAVLIIVVSCVLLKKKPKSSTKGKGKSGKDEESMSRGGNVSDRTDMASRGRSNVAPRRNDGQRKKGRKDMSEYSQRGSTKRYISMSGASTNRYTSRRR